MVVGSVGVEADDRDQRQAGVADLLEQAVEGGLVGDRAPEDRRTVALVAEAQAVEPGGPAAVEVALEADLVASGFVVDRRPFVRSSAPFRRRLRSVAGVNTKLGADVVSGHHQMW